MVKSLKSKRITVMMDIETDKKLRKIQAQKISKKYTSYSYSRVLNEVLEKALK